MIAKLIILTSLLLLARSASRRSSAQMREAAQRAYDHGIRINQQAPCSVPRPELIYLTDRSKIYLPRATLLHRCSDSTGCCAHATQTCRVSIQQPVNLYFFVISGSPHGRQRQSQKIETLTFMNHTECSCQQADNTKLQSILWPAIAGLDDEPTNSSTSGADFNSDNSIDSRSAPIDEGEASDEVTESGSVSNSSVDYEALTRTVHDYWRRTVGLRLTPDQRKSTLPELTPASSTRVEQTPETPSSVKYRRPIYSYTRYLPRPLYSRTHYVPQYVYYRPHKYTIPYL